MTLQHNAFDDGMGWIGAKLCQFVKIGKGQDGRKIKAARIEPGDEILQAGAALGKGNVRKSLPVCWFPSCNRS